MTSSSKPSENKTGRRPSVEAIIYNKEQEICPDYIDLPTFNMMCNYNSVIKETKHLIDRSWEKPYKYYLLVFKPFNSTYEKYPEWYKDKGFDHIRKKIGKVDQYVYTKEQYKAAKIHINAFVVTTRDLATELHEKKTNKFFIHCQEVDASPESKHKVHEYIFKDAKMYNFKKYQHYIYSALKTPDYL